MPVWLHPKLFEDAEHAYLALYLIEGRQGQPKKGQTKRQQERGEMRDNYALVH